MLCLVADKRVDNVVPECVICQLVAVYLDLMLGSRKSVAAIETALETVCKAVPRSYRKEVRLTSLLPFQALTVHSFINYECSYLNKRF